MVKPLGSWQDAITLTTRALQWAEKDGSHYYVAWFELHLVGGLYGQGNLSAAAEALRMVMVKAEEISDKRLLVLAGRALGTTEMDRGAEEAARSVAERAVTLANELADVQMQCHSLYALAYWHLHREDWEQAVELFDQCSELLATTENRAVPLMIGPDYAETCLGLGRLDEAAKIITEHLALARETKSRHYEAVARRVQGQIFTASKHWREARLAFDEAIPALDELGSRLELARALYQRGVLRQAQDAVAEAQADWTRARTLFEQMGAKPMLWRIHAVLGQLAQAQKREDEAEREFAAARAIVEELAANMRDESLRENLLQRAAKEIPPLKPLTPRRAAQREFGGLTEREREVAVRIAQGKSNREIAEELVVSERTIESHVGNILNKLGFTTRAQIRKWAIEKGLVK